MICPNPNLFCAPNPIPNMPEMKRSNRNNDNKRTKVQQNSKSYRQRPEGQKKELNSNETGRKNVASN